MKVRVICSYNRDHSLWSAVSIDRQPGCSTTGATVASCTVAMRALLTELYKREDIELAWALVVDAADIEALSEEERISIQHGYFAEEQVLLMQEVALSVPRLDAERQIVEREIADLRRQLKLRDDAFDALNLAYMSLVDALRKIVENHG